MEVASKFDIKTVLSKAKAKIEASSTSASSMPNAVAITTLNENSLAKLAAVKFEEVVMPPYSKELIATLISS